MRLSLAVLWALSASAVLTSCGTEPGHAVVCVTGTEGALAEARTARVRVLDDAGEEASATTVTFVPGQRVPGETPDALLPFRIPVAPRDEDVGRGFQVEVEWRDVGGAVIAKQRLVGGYDADGIRAYPLTMDPSCGLGVVCAEDEVCAQGVCVATTFETYAIGTGLDSLCPVPTVSATDAFGSAQGLQSWFYGSWEHQDDEVYDPTEDFLLLDWDEGRREWLGDPSGEVLELATTPHRSGPSRLVMIRRWIAPYEGRVSVRFTLSYRDPPTPDRADWELGDGVIALVWHEGEELASLHREPTDRDTFLVYEGSIEVHRGERLDFGIDPGPLSSFYDPVSVDIDLDRLD